MAWGKMRRHMATYENATWHTVCMFVRVCMRVCAINENKHPFQDLCYLINQSPLIYLCIPFRFCQVGLCFSVFVHR